MITFAQQLLQAGYTVYLPSLFGRPGQPASTGAVLRSTLRVCVSREFAILADRTSPVVTWLRALAAAAHRECGGPGVGTIGMCVTGGFALTMAVDPAVLAPVVSQPGLPAPLTAAKRAAVGLDATDLAPGQGAHPRWVVRARAAVFRRSGLSGRAVPDACAASWAAPSRGSRSTPHPAILTPSPRGRMRSRPLTWSMRPAIHPGRPGPRPGVPRPAPAPMIATPASATIQEVRDQQSTGSPARCAGWVRVTTSGGCRRRRRCAGGRPGRKARESGSPKSNSASSTGAFGQQVDGC
jgi:hypothetical protein